MDVIQKLIGDKVPSTPKPSKPVKGGKKVIMIGEGEDVESKKSKYTDITKDEVISLIKSFIREKEDAESE